MNMPGFTAERSLCRSKIPYKSYGTRFFSQTGNVVPSFAIIPPVFGHSRAHCETVCLGRVMWCICDDGYGNQTAEPCGTCGTGGGLMTQQDDMQQYRRAVEKAPKFLEKGVYASYTLLMYAKSVDAF